MILGKTRLKSRTLEELVKISNEGFKDENIIGWEPSTKEYFRKKARSKKRYLIIEKENDAVSGYGLFTVSKYFPLTIDQIVVSPEHRGKGIAGFIIGKVIEFAKNNGVKKISLTTRPENLAMQRACEKQGFVKEAVLKKEFLNKDLMVLALFL